MGPTVRTTFFALVYGAGHDRHPLPKVGGLVETTEQVLGHDPLEILFLALDAVPRAPVRLYGQAREDCIDIALLDNIAALRSVMLVQDVVVDMVDVFHGVSRL